MLVLSRKKDEKIILKVPGVNDISLTVVKIDSQNRVRIGIDADKAVVVLRAELEEGPQALVTTEVG
jgi:carbon storage regulator CsrA